MKITKLYRKYLEHQAVAHPELVHVVGADKTFDMISIQEAVGGFRNSVVEKGYIIRGILPTFQITDRGKHEVKKYYQGGFLIAHYFSNGAISAPSMFEAMDKCEKVGDEICEKMIADSINRHPLLYGSLNTNQDINAQPVTSTGDSTYAGWMYTFPFANHFRNCITHADAPVWADGGKTPHIL